MMELTEHLLRDSRSAWRGPCRRVFDRFRVGDVFEAVRLLAELLKQHPENWCIHRLVGVVRLSQGRARAAQKHLVRARYLLRRERATTGRLRHALSVQREDASLRYLLVRAYIKLGRSKDACALVDEEGRDLWD